MPETDACGEWQNAAFEVDEDRFSAMLAEPEFSAALNIWTLTGRVPLSIALTLTGSNRPLSTSRDSALTPMTGRNHFFTSLSCGRKAIVIWVSQEQDEENAGPGAADALRVRSISVIPARPPALVEPEPARVVRVDRDGSLLSATLSAHGLAAFDAGVSARG